MAGRVESFLGYDMTEEEIAKKREEYRPGRIKVLFVGEAPPANGAFFYCGKNRLLDHMRTAVGSEHMGDVVFLKNFRDRGWYLDDFVTAPIADLRKRREKCRDARDSLSIRIAEYKPQAIVCLLRSIRDDVEIAAYKAGSGVRPYVLQFAGQGHQTEFKKAISFILPELTAL